MYMRAALLALALGQASALLSSPPNEDKHASAVSSPPSDDKHASALTSPPSDDKHASALSSPPSDDKFAVLRGLDDAQVMAEVARRNLNACDGAPPQEHRALTELHYSFKYECSCDPTPEPTAAPTTPAPSPSPTCDYKDYKLYKKVKGSTSYGHCKDLCRKEGMQMPCIPDADTDKALEHAMEHYDVKTSWLSIYKNNDQWKWPSYCNIPGHTECWKGDCSGNRNKKNQYINWKHSEPNEHDDDAHARKSNHWKDFYTWKDIDGKCDYYACLCQPICH